jgi:branched-chain amino acid transport system ATP-binding protein
MLLQTKQVTKRFGGLVAVNAVSLTVDEGSIVGLIGPNGAGKTTLLNLIAGVYAPNGGSVEFKGEPISGLRPETICRRGLSRTFQIAQAFPRMTALENVQVAATFGNPHIADPWAQACEKLDFVEFPAARDTLAMNLNTGQLKRLDLAAALASDPDLLLLDEPGAGLVPGELEDLMHLFLKIRETGVTIVLVEHIMKAIRGVCDKVAVLHYGEKITEGTYSQISADERVVEAYLGERHAEEGG